MANTVKLKRSAVAARVPLVGDLELGELAINTYDGKVYLKKDNGAESIVLLNPPAGGGGDLLSTNNLSDLANPVTARANLGLTINTDVQAYHANLTQFASLSLIADRLPYANGTGTLALATFTSFGRSLVDDANATAGRTTLGVVIGTDVQAYDAGLQSISGLTTAADRMIYTTASDTYAVTTLTSFARTLLDDTTNTAMRTTLGLGTAATRNTGTSGNTIPFLDGTNTWSANQSFSNATISGYLTLSNTSVATGSVLYATSGTLYWSNRRVKTYIDRPPITLDIDPITGDGKFYEIGQFSFNSLEGEMVVEALVQGSGLGVAGKWVIPLSYAMDYVVRYGLAAPTSNTWLTVTPAMQTPRHMLPNFDDFELQARVNNNTISFRFAVKDAVGNGTPPITGQLYVKFIHSNDFTNCTYTQLDGTGTGTSTSYTLPYIIGGLATGEVRYSGNILFRNKITTENVIELGHVSDTTISRVSAGVAAIEGQTIWTTGNLPTVTAFAKTFLDDADAAAVRTTLGAAATSHTHATSDITSGTFANARFVASNVTQFNSSIAPTWANVSGKPTTFTPATHTHAQSDITGLVSALAAKVESSLLGVASGIATLDGSGLVPAAQLPSFVDDVLEYANVAAFPGTGEASKIYVALDTGRTWRWSGSAYTEILASPGTTDNVTEGATNLYYTTTRANSAIDTRVTKTFVDALGINATHLGSQLPAYYLAYGNLTGVPSTFTPSTHTHVIADVTDISAFAATFLDDVSASAVRTTLGLGTSATVNTGTSGATIPLLNAANSFSAMQTIDPAGTGSRLQVGPGYNGGTPINAGDSEIDVTAWTGKPGLRTSRHNVNSWLIGIESDGRLNLTQNGSAAFQVSGNTVWHAGNDGAGSGLDADLLDGLHANTGSIANTIVARDANGDSSVRYAYSQYLNMSHGTTTRSSDTIFYSSTDNFVRKNNQAGMRASLNVWHPDNDGAGSGLDADLLDGIQGAGYARNGGSTTADLNTIVTSGMWRLEGSNANLPSGTAYGQLMVSRGSDTILQIASDYQGQHLYFRNGNSSHVGGSGAYSAWRTIWHSGNDGAGSGLDADTVDGVQLTGLVQQNLYGSFQSSFTSNINANTNRNVGAYGSYASSATNTPTVSGVLLNFTSGSDGSGDGTQFWQDYNSNNLYHRQRWGGTYQAWGQIWTAGNDGAGSGLDADTVDGAHVGTSGATIPLLNATNTFSALTTITSPGNMAYGTVLELKTVSGTDDPALAFVNHNGGSPVRYSISVTDAGALSFNSGGYSGTFGTARVRIGSATTQTLEVLGRLNLTTALGTTRSTIDWGYTQSGLTIWNNDNTPLYLGTSGVNRMQISATGIITLGTQAPQSTAIAGMRKNGNNFEWGHTNTAGYHATLGAEVSTGAPFIALGAEAGTNNNTYRTRGRGATILRGDNGAFSISTLASTNADNQTPTVLIALASNGEAVFTGRITGRNTVGNNVNTNNDTGSLSVRSDSSNAASISFHRTGVFAINMGVGTDNIFRIGGWSASNNCLQLTSTGSLTALGNITAYSDERLKSKIKTLDPKKVFKMRGVSYKKNGKKGSGVIAQELQKVAPELVNDEFEYLSVAYGNIAGYTIEGMKWLKDEIEALKAEIKELKKAA